ncbi:hypothetical protein JCM13991_13220 [Thermodesulfovibrio hydrogeniphilus]
MAIRTSSETKRADIIFNKSFIPTYLHVSLYTLKKGKTQSFTRTNNGKALKINFL